MFRQAYSQDVCIRWSRVRSQTEQVSTVFQFQKNWLDISRRFPNSRTVRKQRIFSRCFRGSVFRQAFTSCLKSLKQSEKWNRASVTNLKVSKSWLDISKRIPESWTVRKKNIFSRWCRCSVFRQADSRCLESMEQSQKWNRASVTDVLIPKKLTRPFKAIFERSNSPKITYLIALIQMLSVQAGLFTRCLCSLKQSQNSNRAIFTSEIIPKKLT